MSEQKEPTILIVDDAPENINILGEILKDYKKAVALNGEKALKIVETKQLDLILLDVMMPGIDGFEVCRRLKANPATKEIPVIFITGKTDVADETLGLELGAVDFIPKPISPPVVLARVKNHLELSLSRRQLAEQNDKLEQHNRYITDSINYAKRIQTAILPDQAMLQSLFRDSFLLFQPKDIVSGDFYWFGQTGTKKIIATVDCTGHGVPGAFMSMIGNTLLNEIVTVKQLTKPSEILHALDQGIIVELNKDLNAGTIDGMDLALCVFDEEQKTVEFASACRPLFFINGNGLNELKGDKKSIGDNRKKIEYTTHSIPWESGTIFYLMSDGFIDQNDAENNKFGTKQVRSLLQEIATLPMPEQKERMYNAFLTHKQAEQQRDDVTVVAVQLPGSGGVQ